MQILNPALVSPLAVYLCHDSCDSTGGLFEVGAGWISRVRWERSQGEYFNPQGFDVDDVADAFAKISDFTDAEHPDTVAYAMKAIAKNPHMAQD